MERVRATAWLVALGLAAGAPGAFARPAVRGADGAAPSPAHGADGAAPSADGNVVERITIAFERGSYAIVSRVPVNTVLPPSDDLPAGPGPFSGFWFELRGADGTLRYRRVIGDPVLLVSESLQPGTTGPGDAAGAPRGLDRAAAVPDARTFVVLVPAARDGDELVLFGPAYAPDARGAMAAPASPAASLEVARLALPPRP
jgi:hypothetical protein